MANKPHGGKIKYKAIVFLYNSTRHYSLIECDHYTDNIWQGTLLNGKEIYLPMDKTIMEEV